jgi:uncharacterized protein YcnI
LIGPVWIGHQQKCSAHTVEIRHATEFRKSRLKEIRMNFCKAALVLASMAFASTAQAHVRVLPFESQPGAHQTYTEGTVATTSVELEVPDGVTIMKIADPAETKKVAGRTVSITWKVEIPPGQSKDFVFEAVNPATNQEMSWKAHQHYADGTSRDWIDLPKTKSPASITKIGPASN